MDSAGSNYPGAVPRWCLATARPPIIEQPRRHFRGRTNWSIRLTRVNPSNGYFSYDGLKSIESVSPCKVCIGLGTVSVSILCLSGRIDVLGGKVLITQCARCIINRFTDVLGCIQGSENCAAGWIVEQVFQALHVGCWSENHLIWERDVSQLVGCRGDR